MAMERIKSACCICASAGRRRSWTSEVVAREYWIKRGSWRSLPRIHRTPWIQRSSALGRGSHVKASIWTTIRVETHGIECGIDNSEVVVLREEGLLIDNARFNIVDPAHIGYL